MKFFAMGVMATTGSNRWPLAYKIMVSSRAVLFWLFPETVNLPPKLVGFQLTFIQ